MRAASPRALRVAALVMPLACGDAGAGASELGTAGASDGAETSAGTNTSPGTSDGTGSTGQAPTVMTVVTFNTGTATGLPHDSVPDDGYGADQAALSDAWYGNGLAWSAFVEDARVFFAALTPDVVVFQEIFWSGLCPDIPPSARPGFVCEGWSTGAPTVAQTVLGPDYQVMCHPGKPDKCAAVRRAFGSFRGCDAELCLEGLEGAAVPGCGSGARVGRAVIELAGGGELTLVNVHGTSGFTADDIACRVGQFEQIFVAGDDGAPLADGARNLVMGDLNTDPGRLAETDASAARLRDFVGPGLPFEFISDVGPEATPTYGGALNIDHVMSDVFTGSCVSPGAPGGPPPVTGAVYFDHLPVICELPL